MKLSEKVSVTLNMKLSVTCSVKLSVDGTISQLYLSTNQVTHYYYIVQIRGYFTKVY